MMTFRTARGRSLPIGATPLADGVNFVALSPHCSAVWLVLYSLDGGELLADIALDPWKNRTGAHWHILVTGLPAAFRYGWRIDGPPGPRHRFDPTRVLLDPAATAVSDGEVWGHSREAEPHATIRRSLFVRLPFNWHEDLPPRIPLEDSLIYELHVRGFTCHPSSGVSKPGTFAGLTEKIPYLKSLGVTAVELLPIHEFDECDCPFLSPKGGQRLRNFWGYNSIAFAATKASYAASGAANGQMVEFREMVRTFHSAGLELFLDVVFNHSGEGDDRGRTYSFRGLDNDLYYMLSPEGNYLNFTGTGNTLNCNHPVVRNLIMDCLRFWVVDMHVDGLRFDLASILGRDSEGRVLVEPPVVESIAADGALADTKLIAEPWDAAGLYQVGRFPYGRRWSEWNGRYRDEVRRFWRGEEGMAGVLATRLCGSADLYEPSGRRPVHSINFLTCHDGFTLNDLVSYNQKHNLENGEENQDGLTENFSWNCGAEGPTDNPAVLALRSRQARNLIATMLLSQGVPMMMAGDEFLRTQGGNNNAWCQDNETSWVDWSLAERHADCLRFVREMIAFRKRRPALRRRTFFHGTGPNGDWQPDVIWHGATPKAPAFTPDGHTLAFSLDGSQTGREPDCDLYIAMNNSKEAVGFQIPLSPSRHPWVRVVDTALPSPQDFTHEDQAPVIPANSKYLLDSFALLVLVTRLG